jgi:hypothetical protein|nr:MAG TPA: nucelotide kinase [Caudoviricetes sp.]DAR68579.1 MAG TPA: nucelotide kinase [Caudoviricetes sp.]
MLALTVNTHITSTSGKMALIIYMEQVDIMGGIDMNDNINKPSHYQGRYGMESIDALRNFMTPEQLKGFFLGNSLKYLLRHQKKNGLEDLKKARKNLDWLIDEVEKELNNDQ